MSSSRPSPLLTSSLVALLSVLGETVAWLGPAVLALLGRTRRSKGSAADRFMMLLDLLGQQPSDAADDEPAREAWGRLRAAYMHEMDVTSDEEAVTLAAFWRWMIAGRQYMCLNWQCGGWGMTPLWRSVAWSIRFIFQRRVLQNGHHCVQFVTITK